ncbi:MAG: hypothetical protein FWF91_00845 [Coriobacteriia bacterium]|nr:hypothetical protein [Coriobacteriia bacterium]
MGRHGRGPGAKPTGNPEAEALIKAAQETKKQHEANDILESLLRAASEEGPQQEGSFGEDEKDITTGKPDGANNRTAPRPPVIVDRQAAGKEPATRSQTDRNPTTNRPATSRSSSNRPATSKPAGRRPPGASPYDDPFLVDAPRRYHIWPALLTAIAVFILLTGGLTYFNRTVLAQQADEAASIKQQGDALLDEAIAFIQEADSVVIALDKATESQIKEEDIPKLEALLDQIHSAQAALDKAIETAQQASDTYLNKESKALAQHAIEAAKARKQMLVMSEELTRYDIAAMRCAITLEYVWSLIIDADTTMRMAVELVAAEGGGAVGESRDYNQDALNKLRLAEEALAKTPEILPGIDVSSLSQYLTARIESVELALASDDAYLAHEWVAAATHNEEFIIKDLEVVDLAARLPSDPVAFIVPIYNEKTQQLKEDYKEARLLAADADAYLRAYLGITVQ